MDYHIFIFKTKKLLILLLISIFMFILPAYSKVKVKQKKVKQDNQETVTLKGKVVTVNMQSMVEYILKQNIDLNIVKSQIEQAKYYYKGSFAQFLPSISGQLPVERFQGGEIFFGPTPIELTRTTYRPAIFGDYQIYTGGKPFFDVKVYKNQYNRIKTSYDSTMQRKLLEACKVYFEWLKSSSDVEVANQSLKEAELQLEYNNMRLKTGFGTKLDVLQTKTLLAEQKNLILKSENQKNFSKINLAILLNLPLSEEIEPEKSFIEPLMLWDKKLTLPELYDISAKTRPDIKELSYVIAQAKAEFGSSIADMFPVISVGGYFRGIGPEISSLDNSAQGVLSLNINLLRNLGLGSYNNVRVAKAKIREAVLNKEKMLDEIYKNIAQAYYNCQFYDQQLIIANEKIENSKEAYRIAMARLKTGIGLNLEVIQTQGELIKANLEYQSAIKDYNISQLQLLYECGILTPERISGTVIPIQ
jgi:multidrug efflux system outer membrane protein